MIDATNEPAWNPNALNHRYDGPLESCPFCASSDVQVYERTYAQEFAFACTQCGARGPGRRSPDQAAEAWNKRR